MARKHFSKESEDDEALKSDSGVNEDVLRKYRSEAVMPVSKNNSESATPIWLASERGQPSH